MEGFPSGEGNPFWLGNSSVQPVKIEWQQQQQNRHFQYKHKEQDEKDRRFDAFQMNDEKHAKFERQEQFRRELDEQLRLKNERRNEERIRQRMMNERERKEIESYNPFGKSGSGAPLRDGTGKVLADLRHSNSGKVIATSTLRHEIPEIQLEGLANTAPSQTDSARQYSRFRFGNVLPEKQEQIQAKLRKQQETQRLLQEQLEEKRRRKELERQRLKEEERAEEARLSREREEIRRAFDREKGKSKKKGNDDANQVQVQNQPKRTENEIRAFLESPTEHRRKRQYPVPLDTSFERGDANHAERESSWAEISQPTISVQHMPCQNPYIAQPRVSVLREELLAEYDSLRAQMRKQDEKIREISRDVLEIKRQNQDIIRKQPAAREEQMKSRNQLFFDETPRKFPQISTAPDFVATSSSSPNPFNALLQASSFPVRETKMDFFPAASIPAGAGLDELDRLLQNFAHVKIV